uniref:Uncharacterized protein n=1 Tax=Amphilophus citrinellus TaxID=61819 RepID=A0A3Q0SQN2_AMPCI
MTRTCSAHMVPSAVLLILLPLFGLQMMLVAKPTTRQSVVYKDLLLSVLFQKPFPDNCRLYKVKISFPDSILPAAAASHSQCRRAMWVTYKFSKELLHMNFQHGFPVGKNGVNWDEKKLDDFLNRLDRLEEEGRCVSTRACLSRTHLILNISVEPV